MGERNKGRVRLCGRLVRFVIPANLAIIAAIVGGLGGLFGPEQARAIELTPPGDVNGDGIANIVDAQCAILAVFWELDGMTGPVPACIPGGEYARADANCNGSIDIVDIQTIIFQVLGAPLDASVDADSNGVVDACQDSEPPVVTITSPKAGDVFASTDGITVKGTVSDKSPVTVKVQGVEATVAADGTWTATGVPLVDGRNILVAVGTDIVGNTGTATVLVVVDMLAPRVRIETPPDGILLDNEEVDVAGLVNDLVQGTTIQSDDVTVSVNGVEATVSNHAFTAARVRLQPGVNEITATATDKAGNTATHTITVNLDPQAGQHVILVSGTGQVAEPGDLLPKPLVVQLLDAKGDPVANRPVHFAVVRGEGRLENLPSAGRTLDVVTDDDGLASVLFRLGLRTGEGNHRVVATAEGFAGFALFRETVNPHPPARIVVHAGNLQTGVVGEQVPLPLLAYVVDDGGNPVGGTTVTFTITDGGGTFADGTTAYTTTTDLDGLAWAFPTLGPWPGNQNNVIEATFPGNTGGKAVFTISAETPGMPENTSLTGIVLDNDDQPVPNATVTIEGTGLTTTTNAEGRFELLGVPVGAYKVIVDGSTTTRPGMWPYVAFEVVTIPGRQNGMGMPVYLPQLDEGSAAQVGPLDVTLHMEGVPGATLTIYGGSATCPDGSDQCVVSFSQVRSDRVPMPPPKGSRFVLAWTVQPAGTRFDPPARVCIPVDDPSLTPGTQLDMYSFDHDLEDWVSIGTGTVTDDGRLCSDPGFGIVKAGWGGGPPPPPPCKCVGQCPSGNECVSYSCSGPPDCKCVPQYHDGAGCKDDGNECTNDVCQHGACTHPPADGQSCKGSDGNSCTRGTCQGGACKNEQPVADGTACDDDGNDCTDDVCKNVQCTHPPKADGTACADDGNECTKDECKGGSCDHPPKPDKLPCTDDDNECTDDWCSGGNCDHPPKTDGTSCTKVDAQGMDSQCYEPQCKGGQCTPNTSVKDGQDCVGDGSGSTDPQCGQPKCTNGQCKAPEDGQPCDDGKFCTCYGGGDKLCDWEQAGSADQCDGGKCRGDDFYSPEQSAGVSVTDALELVNKVKKTAQEMLLLMNIASFAGGICVPDMGWDAGGKITRKHVCCENVDKVNVQYFGSLSGGGHQGFKCYVPIAATLGLVQIILSGTLSEGATVKSDWNDADCTYKWCLTGSISGNGCLGVGLGIPKVLHASASGCVGLGADCGGCAPPLSCSCSGYIGRLGYVVKVTTVGFDIIDISGTWFDGWSGKLCG